MARGRAQVVAVLAGVASIVAVGAYAQGGRLPREREAPSRRDVEATFSRGTVRIDVAGHVFEPEIESGTLSLSTNDAECVPSATSPCSYTVNILRLTARPFEIDGHPLTGVTIRNGRAAPHQLDRGGSIEMIPLVPFWVEGYDGADPFAIVAESRSTADFVRILSLAVTPSSSEATIFAHLSGTVGTDPVQLSIFATADTPFRNLPPRADAGVDREATTSCVTELPLDASATTDPDGNLSRTFYTVSGRSIGSAGENVLFPVGTHAIDLVAEDSIGGRDTDRGVYTVVDDGGPVERPGAASVTIEVPNGTRFEDFALVAQEGLVLANRAEVSSDTGGVASFGTLEVGTSATVGDAWAEGDAALLRDAVVRGVLHAGGSVDVAPSARILGGTLAGGVVPAARTGFSIVLPVGVGPEVEASAGETVRLGVGDHGALRAMPRSTLELAPGVHTASSLDLLAGSRLLATPGAEPTILVITGEVRQLGTVESTAADPALLMVYLGTSPLRVQASVVAWIIAPNATVSIETPSVHRAGSLPEHRGAISARRIEMRATTRFGHVPLSLDFARLARSSCALTAVLECVRESGSGLAAVFGTRSVLDRFGALVPLGTFNRVEVDGLALARAPHQPFTFFPREQHAVFEVPFVERVSWTLGGSRAFATEGSPRCP